MNHTCCICERVPWGQWIYVGHDKWRHAECVAGSRPWMDLMARSSRTPEQELLYTHYLVKGVSHEEGKK